MPAGAPRRRPSFPFGCHPRRFEMIYLTGKYHEVSSQINPLFLYVLLNILLGRGARMRGEAPQREGRGAAAQLISPLPEVLPLALPLSLSSPLWSAGPTADLLKERLRLFSPAAFLHAADRSFWRVEPAPNVLKERLRLFSSAAFLHAANRSLY